MKNMTKSLSIFCASMLVFITMSYSQGVTCTRHFGLYIEGTHIEYWCCTGPEGCFWDVY